MKSSRAISLWIIGLIFFCICTPSFCQTSKTHLDTLQGDVYGRVKDSALNYYFQAASVAVYQGEKKELVSYSLTNSLGEFSIKKLPVGKTLYLTVGFVGYRDLEVAFRLSTENTSFNAGIIYLKKDTLTLGEVVVTSSPVRMHGDTLEFSAGAFKLEKNAVAEDLLKALPGIVVWGDGVITINGRPINKLLVDGKPFFGGDSKIALQNIPKSSVERVQVYHEVSNPYNPFDSITSINLKLRKDHHSGYFGVTSVGIGTNDRNEGTFANSFFNQKDQFTIVGQTNNTNKLTNDILSLLQTTTYKGNGARIDYQPQLFMEGANRQNSGGVIYTHDFIPVFNESTKKRFDFQSFVNQTINRTSRASTTKSTIGIDSTIFQRNNGLLNFRNANYWFDARYYYKSQWDSLLIAACYNQNTLGQQQNSQNITEDDRFQILNTARISDSLQSTPYTAKVITSFFHRGFYNTEVKRLTDWSLLYEFTIGGNLMDRLRSSALNSISVPSQNANYYRLNTYRESSMSNKLFFSLGNFAVALFRNNRFLSRFNMQFVNLFEWNNHNRNEISLDINPTTRVSTKNNNLTRDSKTITMLETPGFRVSRAFPRILANRYQKDIFLDILIKGDIYTEKFDNKATLSKRKYDYGFFTPKVVLSYQNNQYGEKLNQLILDLSTDIKYPRFTQRNLLADSSESYIILHGNPNLSPERRYTGGIGFSHVSYRTKAPVHYGGSVRYGIVKDYIGDSTLFDPTGKAFIYPINYQYSKLMEGSMYIRTAILKGKNQFQLFLKSYFQQLILPGFIGYKSLNSANRTSTSIFTHSDTFQIRYNLGTRLAINFEEIISYYHSRQSGSINGGYTSFRVQTLLGMGVNLFQAMNLSSNIVYNSYPNLTVEPNKFLLLNASVSIRMLRAKNLELKVSALDILRQNQGIFVSGNSHSFTQGTINLLQQYYMVTASFYPRKFEK